MEKATTYGYEEFVDILDKFRLGQSAVAAIQLQIIGGENDLDPEDMLRIYQSDRSLMNSKDLAARLVQGKEVILKSTFSGKELVHFKYVGGDITHQFRSAPYLLDQFYSLCYGILLKKLTPPSSDFDMNEVSLKAEPQEA
jgi:hypothetical protein